MTLDFSSMQQIKSQERKSHSSPRDINIQALSDKNRVKLEEAARIRSEYQKNIHISDSLRCEINKGLKSGEGIYSLFLKAARAISLMTGDTAFYDVARKDLLAIYGMALEKPQVLQIELKEVQARLDNLRQAAEREQDTDDIARIKTAIQYHERAVEQIKKKIEKSNSQ